MKSQISSLLQNRTQNPICRPQLVLLLSLGLVLAGCLSRPALVRQNYALHCSPSTPTAPPNGERVLTLRSVEVSPLYDNRSFIYRTGTDSYEVDPYAGFLSTPSRTLAVSIRTYLRNSGLFKAVAEPSSQLGANTFLEVHAAEMYGDFRQTNQLAAVLSMRLLFFQNSTNGTAPQLFLQKEYSRRMPIPQKTAAALVTGWNQALAEIMTEVASDVSTAKAQAL